MRVLMLSWEYPPQSVGGLARHVQDLATAMVALGYEIHVLTRGAEEAPYYEECEGVKIHRVHQMPLQVPDFLNWVNQLNLALIEKGVKILNQGEFEMIHGHDWLVAYTARVLKHSFKMPLVSTIHATEAGRNQGLHSKLQNYINSIEWFLTYESWRVIVCSKHMENEVRGLFGLPTDKVVRIPNGVYAKKFAVDSVVYEDGLHKLVQEHEQLIFFVGRLVREKGVHTLVEAFPMIARNNPAAKVIIAGTGPMEAQLRHQINCLGLHDRVILAGYVDDRLLKQLYKRADVAVFPSLYEPFGIVALEAMVTNTPVVVADIGGLGEIVEHGRIGLKFYPGNARSLADQVNGILRDRGFAENLSEKARKHVAEQYDWSSIAKKTWMVYSKVREEYESSDWVREKTLSTKSPFSQQERSHYSLMEKRMRIN